MKNLNKLLLIVSVCSLPIFAEQEYDVKRTIEFKSDWPYQNLVVRILPSKTTKAACKLENEKYFFTPERNKTVSFNSKIYCSEPINANPVFNFELSDCGGICGIVAKKSLELPLVSDKKIVITVERRSKLVISEE